MSILSDNQELLQKVAASDDQTLVEATKKLLAGLKRAHKMEESAIQEFESAITSRKNKIVTLTAASKAPLM